MTDKPIVVGRQQTAREEIDLAVHLLFTGGSQICANLLAWAAIDVIKGIASAKGEKTLSQGLVEVVRPEKKAEWIRLLKDHYNFSKHADRDPDRTIQLNRAAIETAVFQAAIDYRLVFNYATVPMLMFQGYYLVNNPGIMPDDHPFLEQSIATFGREASLAEFARRYRTEFLENAEGVYSSIEGNELRRLERSPTLTG